MIKAGDIILDQEGDSGVVIDTAGAGETREAVVVWKLQGRWGTEAWAFTSSLQLHPEADRVLADYTAWLLTQ